MQCIIERVKLKELKRVNNIMDIQIRRAAIHDLEQIENIEKTLNHRILSTNILSSTLDKDNYYYFVATLDNKIVGYICLEYLIDHFDLLAIAVLKEYRRKNIASLLLNEFFTTCLELNISDIFLEVKASNLEAIKLYTKLGFEKISTRKNYYTDTNEDAYIYLKRIA